MAQSDFWRLAPRPGVRAPRNDTELAPHCLVQGLRRAQAPVVAYIEMRYLPQVLDLLDASGSDSPGPVATAPFVLVTSGSDAPLTRALQRRLLRLPGFRACYSTNLHAPPEELKELFHPLPVGFLSGRLNAHNEALLAARRRAAPCFAQRDARLLLPWMRSWKLRRSYRNLLEMNSFKDLVHVVTDRLPFPDYLAQLGSHRYVLSPPGKGYDCTRTWEALAMGSIPVILRDENFDMRIYQQASVRTLPPPEELTPDVLAQLLSTKATPVDTRPLQVHYWTNLWRQHLDGGHPLARRPAVMR